MKTKHTNKSTFDRMIEDAKWKADFDKGYEEFLLSEFICEQMESNNITVRDLAHRAGVSPTTIQNMRSGNADNVKLKTLLSVLHELGFKLNPVAYRSH
ncbi:MAG: helix-turn-helix transcriptional regulator [Lachnospiraceae bacterium]|nr:helix-turn-helix transcriptional regulator [Lachnospiraceae bacterium]